MQIRCLGSSSRGNCWLLENNEEILILDAGIPIKEVLKAIEYRLERVVGVFVSHEHKDHSLSAEEFRHYGVNIFEPYKGGAQSIKLGEFYLRAFDLPHNGTENRGVVVDHKELGRLIYMTDMEYCPYSFNSWKPNHLIVEANYRNTPELRDLPNYQHIVKGHCEIETSLRIVETNMTDALTTCVLAHLSHKNSNVEYFIERLISVVGEDVQIHIARKGLTINTEKER